MKLKTLALLLLTAMLALTLLGCGEGGSDLEYILANDKMVIGITYYAPMDYKNDAGELVGFDHDLAAAVCEKLGVTPVFQEIDWNTKENELISKTIDVIWNGMTVTPERAEAMSLTKNYMLNKQVVVTTKALAEGLTELSGLAGKKGAAEAGSAGEEAIKAQDALKDGLVSVAGQSDALLEVKAGTSDYCVIDAVMANYLVGSGTDFADLVVMSDLLGAEDEYYAAACRKDSDLTAKINEILVQLYKDGKVDEIAAKYGLSDVLVPIQE